MASRYVVFAAAGLWLGFFVISFVVFNATGPSGDGFSRSMDRAGALLAWQSGAMAAALAALAFTLCQKVPRGFGLSFAGLVPMIVMALELIAVVVLAIWMATRDPTERIERFYYPNPVPAQGGN